MGRFLDYMLGGSTSPMAGDGYGHNSALKTSSKQSRGSGVGTHVNNTDEGLVTPSTRSPEPPPVTLILPEENIIHGNEETLGSPNPWAGADSFGDGTPLATRSRAPKTGGNLAVQSPRTSGETFRTCSEDSAVEYPQKHMQDIPWQGHKIPEELAIVEDGTPQEIRIIIQESLDEQQAVRASILQYHTTHLETDQEEVREVGVLMIAESSSMASARSSSSGEYSRSSFNIPASSNTSLETDAEDKDNLKAPPTTISRSSVSASRESLQSKTSQKSETTGMESRFLNSKIAFKKSHRLVKLLRHEKGKHEVPRGAPKVQLTIVECTSCFDDVPDAKAVALLCRHHYCKSCFTQLVSTAIEHEVNFPPKCCLTEISKTTIRDNLPPEMCVKFEIKALEYAIPASNRYYCVSSTCGKWIDTRYARCQDGAVECQHCSTRLCSVCRGPQHPANEECPQDFGLDRTLEQAERAGWRRCYNCRTMVELNDGCRHITCKCRAEFW